MARGGAIYLGNDAEIEFERKSLRANGKLLRESISTVGNRFGFEYSDSVLTTGDRIRITRTDKDPGGGYKNLVLEANAGATNNAEAFVYVDMLGRIYLYDTLTESLTQQGANPRTLTQGTTTDFEQDRPEDDYYQNITYEVIEQGFRPFAKCNEYQLTTSKDTIDVTTLGEYFYKQYENGLIGGQGTVTAIWDEQSLSDSGCPDPYVKTQGDELSAYFAKLILRIQIGAGFRGRFYLRSRDITREPVNDRYAIFWQADCVCTNVAIQALPGQMLQSRIEFVTTGLFQLEIADGSTAPALSLESGLLMERESDMGLLLTD